MTQKIPSPPLFTKGEAKIDNTFTVSNALPILPKKLLHYPNHIAMIQNACTFSDTVHRPNWITDIYGTYA